MNCAKPLYLLLVALAGCVAPPALRSQEEGSSAIQALLITGGCSHDYERRREVIVAGIRERIARKIEWKVRLQGLGESDEKISIFEEPGWAGGYDIVVHDYCFPRVSDSDYVDNILSPHQEGLPAVLIHGTLHSFRVPDDRWSRFCGVSSLEHDTEHPFEVRIEASGNPVLKGAETWTATGGQLYRIDREQPGITRLTVSPSPKDGTIHLTSWSHLYGAKNAKVFATSIGNDLATMQQTEWLDMVARGFLWALGELNEENYKTISPDESLKGLNLSHANSSLPQVGRNAALSGEADAITSELPANPPGNAVDGVSSTLWRSSRPGPSSWSVRLPITTEIQYLALIWDGVAPAEYSLESSQKEGDWNRLTDHGDGRLRQVDLIQVPKTRASYLRLSVPYTANDVTIGLREFAAYRSLEEVPAALRERAETSSREAESPERQTAGKPGDPDPFPHRTTASLQEGERGLYMIPTARGDAFVLTERQDGKRTIRYAGKSRDGNISLKPFLENLERSAVAAWDGEWLYVMENFVVTAYRDTNRDGVADEKFSHGPAFIPGKESESRTHFRNMFLGDDGWIYASVESPDEESGYCSRGHQVQMPRHGIVRFRRNGKGLSVALRSRTEFGNWIPGEDGGLLVDSNTGEEDGGLFSLPPVSVPVWDDLEPLDVLRSGERLVGAGFRDGLIWVATSQGVARRDMTSKSQPVSTSIPLKNVLSACTGTRGQLWVLCKDKVSLLREETAEPPVDLDRVPNGDLFLLLSGENSVVRREASLEILRRRRFPEGAVFHSLADADSELQEKRALLATAGQLGGIDAFKAAAALTEADSPEIRASAYLTLADFPDAENDALFGRISREKSPLVTSRIVAGILRSRTILPGMDRLAFELASEDDPFLSVSGLSYLVEREQIDVCFAALDEKKDEPLWPVAFRILTRFQRPSVVEGIVLRVEKTRSPEFRTLAFNALAALYYKDTGGKEEWPATSLIDAVFRASLLDKRVNRTALLELMTENEIPLDDPGLLVELGSSNIEFESFAIDRLIEQKVPASASAWLSRVWEEEAKDPDLRVRALSLLCGMDHREDRKELFAAVSEAGSMKVSEASLSLLHKNWFALDHAGEVVWLVSQSRSSNPERSRLAFRMLYDLLGREKKESKVREQIDREWAGLAESDSPRRAMWEEAGEWYREFSGDPGQESRLLSALSTDELVKKLSVNDGNAGRGKSLFNALGCAPCHNVHGEGPGVGPSLLHGETKKDISSLVDAIRNPSKEVHPEFKTWLVALKDGTRWRGLLEWENDEEIVVRDAAANLITLDKDEVESKKDLKQSIMPEGAVDYLPVEEWNDLLSYLRSL